MDRAASQTFQNTPDEHLVAVAQGRSGGEDGASAQAALEELFRRYHARVHAWSARLLGDDAADDATQEIFLGLLARPARYEERSNFGAWLYVVTRNHCLNLRRRREQEVTVDPLSWLEDALVSPSNPAAEVEEEELGSAVRRICTEALTPVEQKVIHLRYHWGMRVKEIGLHLQLENVSGARTHLATATRKIREELAARFGEAALRDLFEGD